MTNGLYGHVAEERMEVGAEEPCIQRDPSQSVSQVAFVQVLATAVARIEATPVASACYSAALAANKTWMEY